MILNKAFNHVENGNIVPFVKGSDVSHLPDEAIKFLEEGGHIEVSEKAGNKEAGGPLKAADLIKLISEAETVEAVDALVSEEESRATVLKAAEARRAELEVE